MDNIPDCFYRVSVKALVLNESRDKFLIVKEDSGRWDLPGGGLDWGMESHEELRREVREEMGLKVTWIAENPCYFLVGKSVRFENVWRANIVYEAELEHLEFTPSEECVDVAFVNASDVKGMEVFPQINELAERFESKRHEHR